MGGVSSRITSSDELVYIHVYYILAVIADYLVIYPVFWKLYTTVNMIACQEIVLSSPCYYKNMSACILSVNYEKKAQGADCWESLYNTQLFSSALGGLKHLSKQHQALKLKGLQRDVLENSVFMGNKIFESCVLYGYVSITTVYWLKYWVYQRDY